MLTEEIHNEALKAAKDAAAKFFEERLGGVDQFACGFAWVNAWVDGRTKVGKSFKALGFSKSYDGSFMLWNPSKFPCQNVDTLEAGAQAYAKVIRERLPELTDKVFAGSRLD